MLNQTLWNLMFSWQTRLVLVGIAWLLLTVVFISIRLRNKQPRYRKALTKKRKLLNEYFKLWGHPSPRLNQLEQHLNRLDHYQPKSLLTHRQELQLGVVSGLFLLLAVGSSIGGSWFADKFTIGGFDSNYATQESVPIKSYRLYRHGRQCHSIFRADHAKLTTVENKIVYMRVDNHDHKQIVNIDSHSTSNKKQYQMILTQVIPKKQYQHYAGSEVHRTLDVRNNQNNNID